MFPDRTFEIKLHRENAFKKLKEGNFDHARKSFFAWVESVRQQNINTGGKLELELEEAKRAYSEFAKNDPLFIKICNIVFPIIKQQPQIFQTEIYKILKDFDRNDISYTLYFAAEHGKIRRTKKGRTYSIELIE